MGHGARVAVEADYNILSGRLETLRRLGIFAFPQNYRSPTPVSMGLVPEQVN